MLSAQCGSPLAEWAEKESIPGIFNRNYHAIIPSKLVQSYIELRRIIAEFRPDLLNPHCPPGHALLALANGNRRPLIRTVADPRQPKSHFINRYLHVHKTDGIIYSTASSLPRYAKSFSLTNTIEQVVLPGLDLSLFPNAKCESWRRKLKIDDDVLFAAVIARMSPEKGQELLVEALSLLPETSRNKIVILLTGDDSKERAASDIVHIALQKGVQNQLRFAPRQADIRPLLSEIQLGIITSTRSEAVCRIALEYMAYGKPIISTDVNILSEVVRNGGNGWCVSAANPRMLAAALHEAIENRALLSIFGQQGNELLRTELTLEKMTENTLEFYNKVIEHHARRR